MILWKMEKSDTATTATARALVGSCTRRRGRSGCGAVFVLGSTAVIHQLSRQRRYIFGICVIG